MMRYWFTLLFLLILMGCRTEKPRLQTPWGTDIGGDSIVGDTRFTLDDIVANGEMIMLTMTGPETYYDYRGHGMGLQYLLCEQFAQQLGVSLRVEVCKDTAEMVQKLVHGDGDLIAFPLTKGIKGLVYAGPFDKKQNVQWAVKANDDALADTLNRWFKPELIAKMQQEETFLLSSRSVTRKVYSPMLDRTKGVISPYDGYFKKYAPMVRWDWRFMAAQCYQESTFDPNARSWVGARGLMQIMPKTAAQMGLAIEDIHNPERNIAAAMRYIKYLDGLFKDITNVQERRNFVLASYNGGHFHIRDAMALTKKNGRNPMRWNEVSEYVLKLSSPQYYRDPIVKYGYMRGSETVNYVSSIHARYNQYRGVAKESGFSSGFGLQDPRKATRKHRFKL